MNRKMTILPAILMLFSAASWGQNNTFPVFGNVGIGTTNPQSGLQIGEVNNNTNSKQITIPGVYNFETIRLGQIGNGNAALELVNHTGTPNSSYGVRILADIDNGGPGLQLQYAQSKSNYADLDYKTGLMLNTSGNVGIGTTMPNEKLSVNGNIRAKEIKVEAANWPDYVFDLDYKVLGLKELDAYIKANKRLPEMPSAAVAEKDGVGLGELNKLLLKKVEELTLLLIEQNKLREKDSKRISELEKRNNTLNK